MNFPHFDVSPGRPWIALLDCACVHISKEFLSKAREGLPCMKKIHIPAGYTSVAQPWDVAFMNAFKCAMARTAHKNFARCVLQLARQCRWKWGRGEVQDPPACFRCLGCRRDLADRKRDPFLQGSGIDHASSLARRSGGCTRGPCQGRLVGTSQGPHHS